MYCRAISPHEAHARIGIAAAGGIVCFLQLFTSAQLRLIDIGRAYPRRCPRFGLRRSEAKSSAFWWCPNFGRQITRCTNFGHRNLGLCRKSVNEQEGVDDFHFPQFSGIMFGLCSRAHPGAHSYRSFWSISAFAPADARILQLERRCSSFGHNGKKKKNK